MRHCNNSFAIPDQMVKYIFPAIIFIFNGQLLYAQGKKPEVEISAYSGYPDENLQWSIAGNINGTDPNIYSELKWRDLHGPVLDLEIYCTIWRRLSAYGAYNRMFVLAGSVNDKDYNGNGRTQNVYTGDFIDNKGYAGQWMAGLGYNLLHKKLFTLTPYIGYLEKRQLLFLLGSHNISEGLDSYYATNWKGLFFKLNSSFYFLNNFSLIANISYCQADYHAKADWNLITTFQHPVSYAQYAKGYGLAIKAGLNFQVVTNFQFGAGFDCSYWQTGNGIDLLYLTSGNTDKTQLNRVVSNGFLLYAGLMIVL